MTPAATAAASAWRGVWRRLEPALAAGRRRHVADSRFFELLSVNDRERTDHHSSESPDGHRAPRREPRPTEA